MRASSKQYIPVISHRSEPISDTGLMAVIDGRIPAKSGVANTISIDLDIVDDVPIITSYIRGQLDAAYRAADNDASLSSFGTDDAAESAGCDAVSTGNASTAATMDASACDATLLASDAASCGDDDASASSVPIGAIGVAGDGDDDDCLRCAPTDDNRARTCRLVDVIGSGIMVTSLVNGMQVMPMMITATNMIHTNSPLRYRPMIKSSDVRMPIIQLTV